VNTTPNFQIWYLMSIDVILQRGGKVYPAALLKGKLSFFKT